MNAIAKKKLFRKRATFAHRRSLLLSSSEYAIYGKQPPPLIADLIKGLKKRAVAAEAADYDCHESPSAEELTRLLEGMEDEARDKALKWAAMSEEERSRWNKWLRDKAERRRKRLKVWKKQRVNGQ